MEKEQTSKERDSFNTDPLRQSGRIISSRYMQTSRARTSVLASEEKNNTTLRSSLRSSAIRPDSQMARTSNSHEKQREISKGSYFRERSSNDVVSNKSDIRENRARESSREIKTSAPITHREPFRDSIKNPSIRSNPQISQSRLKKEEMTQATSGTQSTTQIRPPVSSPAQDTPIVQHLEYILWALVVTNSETLYFDQVRKIQNKLENSIKDLVSEYEKQQESNIKLDCLKKLVAGSQFLIQNKSTLESINANIGIVSKDYENMGKLLQKSAGILPISNLYVQNQDTLAKELEFFLNQILNNNKVSKNYTKTKELVSKIIVYYKKIQEEAQLLEEISELQKEVYGQALYEVSNKIDE